MHVDGGVANGVSGLLIQTHLGLKCRPRHLRHWPARLSHVITLNNLALTTENNLAVKEGLQWLQLRHNAGLPMH